MEKELKQAYTMRISQANPTELIVILYELIEYDLEAAKTSVEKQDQAEYHLRLEHGCKCVNELLVALDFQYPISYDLMRLYRYVNECIIRAKIRYEASLLESALDTIRGLKSAFEEVAKKDMSGSVMKNTEQVYVGLTYSKGTLNESLLENSYGRGFRA